MKKAGWLRRTKKITLFLAAAISTASVFPLFAGSDTAVVPAVYATFQTTAANTQTTGTLTVQVPAGYIQGDSSDGTITFINESIATVVSVTSSDIGVDVSQYFSQQDLKDLTEGILSETLIDEQNTVLTPVQSSVTLLSGNWMRYQYDNYRIDDLKCTATAYIRYNGQYMEMILTMIENSQLQNVNSDQVVNAFLPAV